MVQYPNSTLSVPSKQTGQQTLLVKHFCCFFPALSARFCQSFQNSAGCPKEPPVGRVEVFKNTGYDETVIQYATQKYGRKGFL